MSTPLVVLITAGSAGLGAATARVFAKAGMRVIINYSSNELRASILVKELHQISPLSKTKGCNNFVSIRADLSKRSDIQRLVSGSILEMGKLDAVFSNGGWTSIQDFNDLDDNVDEEMWDKCWNMNVKSHLWLMHASKKYLDETEGAFITTASLAGVRPSGSSLDWGLKFPQERLDSSVARSQLKRFATVEDVAEQVLYFVRSRSVTGVNMLIDAGWSL
ncbi:Uncharacterized protein BP5553_09857 [Venustampulla echinocandica]|uniref:NAD(P)-binding protein n=1 Tax=Venustampulla echinocandica TaxID=2656787 RepID=A0A370TAY6_9HELO|nr:Uncharacterized protein BP5553_09857 [Venustampulla echinocandica]RDL31068.1 Uncharacterized protein BP5553_09857 [Venustampulla echinocandica]